MLECYGSIGDGHVLCVFIGIIWPAVGDAAWVDPAAAIKLMHALSMGMPEYHAGFAVRRYFMTTPFFPATSELDGMFDGIVTAVFQLVLHEVVDAIGFE